MLSPRLRAAACYTLFGACLLLAAVLREGPSTAVDQAVIWWPSGVAVAGVFLLGWRALWVVAGFTLAQRLLIPTYGLPLAIPAAIGSSAEAFLGVWILHRLGFRPSLARLRDVGAILAAAVVAPVASIAFSWIGRLLFWRQAPLYSGWDGWWRMNALGIIMLVPLALHWLTLPRTAFGAREIVGSVLGAVGVPATTFVLMMLVPDGLVGVPVLNLALLLGLYAAVRFGVRGATFAGALAALTLATATTHGWGPFIELERAQRPVAIQLFELSVIAIPLIAGALIAERQAAQKQRERSEELRLSIQSALPDILYRLDRSGTCLEVFVPSGVIAPLSSEAFIGRSMYEFFPPAAHEQVTHTILSAFERGEVATLEYEVDLQGRHSHREARVVPHGENEVLAVVRDITDRKWAEGTTAFETRVLERIAAGASRNEVLAEIVMGLEQLVPGSLASILTLSGDRLHLAAAPSLPGDYNAAIEGLDIGPEVGSCGSAAFHGQNIVVTDIETDPRWAAFRSLAARHGLRACWSIPFKDAGGKVLGTLATYYRTPRAPQPIELQLAERAGALVGIVLDREYRREALRRSEELLSSLNRNVKEGLFRLSPDLKLVYANRALGWLLGHEAPESVLGRSLAAAVEDPSRREALVLALAEHREWLNEEVRLRRADGSAFWGLLSVTPVYGETGELTHLDGAIADITARKELEEQFRQSQKMEAVGKLAGGVAHDFNNLLTVILGYADTIEATSDPQSPTRAQAAQIVEAAQRASRLTRQLLAYSRQQVLSPQVLDLSAVVDELGGMLRRLIGEDVRLVIQHHDGSCWVRVDRGQWEQVLLNLVVNARDAMPAGGTLTISTARRSGAGAPSVLLCVHDTGVGMSSDVQARAFDPFFTTKAPGEGTGLGLSTVYGIVNQSGGDVRIESAPGAGTRFWVTLPLVEERPEVPVSDRAPSRAIRTGTVLVVEDEAEVRALVCRTLELDGHRVLSASNGVTALEVYERSATPIDLVVSDVVMPHMGGRELARHLRERHPGVRFLFISGYAEHAGELEEFVGPHGDFLGKPFTIAQLSGRVSAILAGEPSGPEAQVPPAGRA